MSTSVFPDFGTLDHMSYSSGAIAFVARRFRALSHQAHALPFDPSSCASALGLHVKLVRLPPATSGQLRTDLEPITIELREGENPLRQRFTLAHEIAHLCFLKHPPALPKERGVPSLAASVQRREESLCDRIAAELLMPSTSFSRRARRLQPSLLGLRELSSSYAISTDAALTRIRELRLWTFGRAIWSFGDSDRLLCNRIELVLRRGIRSRHDQLRVTSRLRAILRSVESQIQDLGVDRTSIDHSFLVGDARVSILRMPSTNQMAGLLFL